MKSGIGLRGLYKQRYLYMMVLPLLAYYIIFCYLPMYGITLAFKELNLSKGITGSPWADDPFKYFKQAFQDSIFWRSFNNTLIISAMKLVFGFPVPIILALLLNAMMSIRFRKIIQTIIYLPRFISWVIVSGLLVSFLSLDSGMVNQLLEYLGKEPIDFLANESGFRWLLVFTEIWKGAGFASIIYMAALTALNPELFEAATVDGASKWQQVWNVTLPGIMPTILIMFILQVGNILNANFEQVYALYNPAVYSTADIIDTYVFRTGIEMARYSYSTAVGLFKSVISLLFLLIANYVVRRFGEEGLF